jgi:hypothetical protein
MPAMKLNVADRSALSRVDPMDLEVYLSRHGWTLGYELKDRLAEVWRSNALESEHPSELIIPRSRDLIDYSDRVGRILAVLSDRLEKSQFDVWSDLVSARSDVVTIRLEPEDESEGRLPADYAKSVVDGAYDLFMASACSALDPKPYFHARKPDGAVSWLEGLKMGLTRPGSYMFVFILESVEGRLGADATIPLDHARFERRVLGTASVGLSGIVAAADIHSKEGGYDAFIERVPSGVSANLCEAVVKIIDPGQVKSVDFSFSWALRSTALDVPPRVDVAPGIRPIVEKAAEILKEQDPRPGVTLEGFIHKLSRKEYVAAPGKVHLETLVYEGTRSVEIELDAETYHKAVLAHDQKRRVSIAGTLRKYGGKNRLEDPHDFKTLET